MTSGENWTPGPWRVQDACVRSHRGVVAPLGQYVYVGADEDQANAHLIAAAPDLYAALVAAQDLIAPENVQERAMIRAALAKARGEVQP